MLRILVFGALSRGSKDECHQWKVSGRSPSEASQVTLVLLPATRSSLNWKGTILGGMFVVSEVVFARMAAIR